MNASREKSQLQAERITRLRIRLDMSQEAMAKALDISRRSQIRTEMGTREPEQRELAIMSALSGESIDFICGITDEPSATPGARLRRARTQMGLSLEDVAKRINEAAWVIHQWEEDTETVPLESAVNLAALLGIDSEDLTGDTPTQLPKMSTCPVTLSRAYAENLGITTETNCLLVHDDEAPSIPRGSVVLWLRETRVKPTAGLWILSIAGIPAVRSLQKTTAGWIVRGGPETTNSHLEKETWLIIGRPIWVGCPIPKP